MTKEEKHTGKASTQHGGLGEAEMVKFEQTLNAKQAKIDTLTGEMSAEWKKVEDAGGNKAAFKLAMKLRNMEETKAYDFLKSTLGYLTGLGFMQQMDLFDQKQNIELSSTGPAPQRTADAAIKEVYKGGAKNNGEAIASAMQSSVN